ncbi:DUF5914 domain-containing protein [Rhodococcus sp. C26F]
MFTVPSPALRGAATRLWRDDLAYAERRYQQRAPAGCGIGPRLST